MEPQAIGFYAIGFVVGCLIAMSVGFVIAYRRLRRIERNPQALEPLRIKTDQGIIETCPIGSRGLSLVVSVNGGQHICHDYMAIDSAVFWQWWRKLNQNEKLYDEDGDLYEPWNET